MGFSLINHPFWGFPVVFLWFSYGFPKGLGGSPLKRDEDGDEFPHVFPDNQAPGPANSSRQPWPDGFPLPKRRKRWETVGKLGEKLGKLGNIWENWRKIRRKMWNSGENVEKKHEEPPSFLAKPLIPWGLTNRHVGKSLKWMVFFLWKIPSGEMDENYI